MKDAQLDLSRSAERSRYRGGPRRSPVELMGELLSRMDEPSNAERIRQMREVFFADVDALQQSGTVKLPE